ncbi:MAG: hypothetical protein HKN88_04415 [Gammaproteobacteria bacterium]|nr:hypothetical protein [Gammaproteobacteria bacterium]NNC97296.1 hypothetical protein [Gammaproteobacteria bacterium]NNM14680.1 hypothetical protein [Gammaproteobacteria bacterium]
MPLADVLQSIKSEIKELAITELPELGDDAVLIDVRETEEFNAGALPGALHLSRGTLEFKLSNMPEITPDTPVYLYCRSGNRSAYAARSLQELGYKNVTSLSGGYVAWSAAHPSTLA